MEEKESLSNIKELLSKMKTDMTKHDAFLFTLENKNIKNNISRIIAYLLLFDQISPSKEKYIDELVKIYEIYLKIRIKVFENEEAIQSPLSLFDIECQELILSEAKNIFEYFPSDSESLQLKEDYKIDSQLHIFRILSVICNFKHKDEFDYSYVPGYLHHIYPFYLICCNFSQKFDLPIDFAEAIAFAIVRVWIPFVRISSFLKNEEFFKKHFNELDSLIDEHCPHISRILQDTNSSSFALKWHLTLFSEIHPISELFLIWDQIVGRKSFYRRVVDNLCIAHLKQIDSQWKEIQNESKETEEDEENILFNRIHSRKGWDVNKMIDDNLSLFNGDFKICTKEHFIVLLFSIILSTVLVHFALPYIQTWNFEKNEYKEFR